MPPPSKPPSASSAPAPVSSQTGMSGSLRPKTPAEPTEGEIQARLAAIVESSHDAIIGKTLDGIITNWNRAAEIMFGFAAAEIIGQPIMLLLPADRQDEEGRIIQQILNGETISRFETVRQRKDGSLVAVSLTVSPIRNRAGVTIGASKIVRDITSRKRAEEALQLFRTLVDRSNDALEVIDPVTGRLLDVNQQSCADLGFTREELLDRTVFDISPEVSSEMWPQMVKATRAQGHFLKELIHLRKDGTTFPVEVNGRLVQLEKEYMVASVRNITERKKSEAALRLFRTLVDQSTDAFEVIDPDTARLLDVNEQCCASMGYTRAELLTRTVMDIDPSMTWDKWREGLRVARQQGFRRLEGIHLRKDGAIFPIEVNLKLVKLDREYIVSIVRDITERKRAEKDLRESEERFRQIAENIAEVFWVSDEKMDRVLYVSPAYEKIWGRTCASLYESPHQWLQAIHPDDRERVLAAAIAKQNRGEYDETYRILRPDGAVRWIHDRGFPIRHEQGAVYRVVGIAEDITQQRKLEEQYRHAQKMEAIGTLAGGIAHDFNNILAAMNGYAELAKMAPNVSPLVREYLDTILKAGGRAVALVRQILTFSRQQEQQRLTLQLRDVVEESLKLLRATIPSTIEFQTALAPDALTVLADVSQIHQIIMNLGTNAWHAMRDKPGRLEVKLENFTVDAAMAETHAHLRPGPYVRLSVSDTGCGINRATLEHIFEPFFTTKAHGEGTGLGLSVVHGIMEGHDGAITVYSEVGHGTVFHLYFPAHTGQVIPVAAGEAPIPLGGGKRILFVDDEEALAGLGGRILKQLGYVVETETNPVEALEIFRAHPQNYDLVITDQTMPHMTGVDLAKQLLEIRPGLPIIVTTGHSPNLTVTNLQALGIRDLLPKPHTIQLLARTIHRALAVKPLK